MNANYPAGVRGSPRVCDEQGELPGYQTFCAEWGGLPEDVPEVKEMWILQIYSRYKFVFHKMTIL